MLCDLVQGKSNSDTLILYLVVRFPGASFALPSDEDAQCELPVTVGEESMMRSSRIVLRGTVTIPVPERDMQRVVHRILNRGAGSATPSLEDLVSSMSYLPRYRRLDSETEAPARRAPAAGTLNHRRRRRRRMARGGSVLAVDLRAHSLTQISGGGPLSSLSSRGLGSGASVETSLQSWSHYLDLEVQEARMAEEEADDDVEHPAQHRREQDFVLDHHRHDLMFDQDLGLDTSHQSVASNASLLRAVRDADDLNQVHVSDDEQADTHHHHYPHQPSYNSYRTYTSPSYHGQYEGLEGDEGANYELSSLAAHDNECLGLGHGQNCGCGESGCGERAGTQPSNAPRRRADCQQAAILPANRKRKHSDMCGHGMFEQRLTARCRNLSLDDARDQDEDDLDKHLSPQQVLVENDRQVLDRDGGGVEGEAQISQAVAARHLPTSASLPDTAAMIILGQTEDTPAGETARIQDLPQNHKCEPDVCEAVEAHGTDWSDAHGIDECEDQLPCLDVHHTIDGEYVAAAGAAVKRSGSSSYLGSNSASLSCATSFHRDDIDDTEKDKLAAACLAQDKEGGIHMSCDPLASLPLQHLTQSASSGLLCGGALMGRVAHLEVPPHLDANKPHPDARIKHQPGIVGVDESANVLGSDGERAYASHHANPDTLSPPPPTPLQVLLSWRCSSWLDMCPLCLACLA